MQISLARFDSMLLRRVGQSVVVVVVVDVKLSLQFRPSAELLLLLSGLQRGTSTNELFSSRRGLVVLSTSLSYNHSEQVRIARSKDSTSCSRDGLLIGQLDKAFELQSFASAADVDCLLSSVSREATSNDD